MWETCFDIGGLYGVTFMTTTAAKKMGGGTIRLRGKKESVLIPLFV